MAKRRAGVNDIIYELDNEDIEISSEDEVKEPKKSRLESDIIPSSQEDDVIIEESCTDVINLDSSCSTLCEAECKSRLQNGGKIADIRLDNMEPVSTVQNEDVKKGSEYAKATILNEDIVVDSPSSNNYVNDFTNRTPIVTVRFRDNKVASNYKKKIKAFMINLIKLHDEENLIDTENDTDLELDIWPDDFEDELDKRDKEVEDNLFFVDTDPNVETNDDIPSYRQASTLISNSPQKETTPPPNKWKPTCFNCDGFHSLKDCTLPRNSAKIAENRKQKQKVGRYHIEDEQKFGHLIPGRISGQLRHALGLKRHEIPLHIYRMRLLGYPPGWLEEARISHSGITMFDSTGKAILDPEEEEGELCEPGSKDKFDIKKLLDFPGFNVPASSRYKEEAHLFGLPPMLNEDSKLAMLQTLAPNAMKAYKRKKLAIFPSAVSKLNQDSPAEMELDSGDEEPVFPSVPPLPDEAPPMLPPPPPESPPPDSPILPPTESHPPPPPPDFSRPLESRPPAPNCPSPSLNPSPLSLDSVTLPSNSLQLPTESSPSSKPASDSMHSSSNSNSQELRPLLTPNPKLKPSEQPTLPEPLSKSGNHETVNCLPIDNNGDEQTNIVEVVTDDDDLEIIQVTQVKDIPMPIDNCKTISENHEINQEVICLGSPSLDDLESKKQLLLDALKDDNEDDSLISTSFSLSDDSDKENDDNKAVDDMKENIDNEVQVQEKVNDKTEIQEEVTCVESIKKENNTDVNKSQDCVNESDMQITKESKIKTTGAVRGTEYGTPVMNVESVYVKLPSDEKFAKDISDVIYFENLPNSTGTFKRMSTLLKKVKNEVDRIQES